MEKRILGGTGRQVGVIRLGTARRPREWLARDSTPAPVYREMIGWFPTG
jgi:hypothetical protein